MFIAESNPDTLKTKKSELRLYCDLLMQQVHVVKTAANSEPSIELEVCKQPFQTANLFMIYYRKWMKQPNSYQQLVILL